MKNSNFRFSEIYNPQFIGIGHKLQKLRHQRKYAEAKEKKLSTHVSFLEKQSLKMKKIVTVQQKQLKRLYEIANRRDESVMNKNLYLERKAKEQQSLLRSAERERLLRQRSKKQVMQSLRRFRSSEVSRLKNSLKDSLQQRRVNQRLQLSEKQSKTDLIKFEKTLSQSRINEFHLERNNRHTREYKRKIELQNQMTGRTNLEILELTERQRRLKEHLEGQASQIDILRSTIHQFGSHRSTKTYDGDAKVSLCRGAAYLTPSTWICSNSKLSQSHVNRYERKIEKDPIQSESSDLQWFSQTYREAQRSIHSQTYREARRSLQSSQSDLQAQESLQKI